MMDWFDDARRDGSKRPCARVLDRRREVARLWNQHGMGVVKTAKKLGVSYPTIVADRRWLLDRWQEVVEADISEMVGRECKKIDEIESEAWRAWRKSWKDKEKRRTKREALLGEPLEPKEEDEPDQPPGVLISTTDEVEGRLPESKFLLIILDCQERRAKLLGLYKAVSLADMTFDFAEMVKGGYQAAVEQRARAKKAAEDSD